MVDCVQPQCLTFFLPSQVELRLHSHQWGIVWNSSGIKSFSFPEQSRSGKESTVHTATGNSSEKFGTVLRVLYEQSISLLGTKTDQHTCIKYAYDYAQASLKEVLVHTLQSSFDVSLISDG